MYEDTEIKKNKKVKRPRAVIIDDDCSIRSLMGEVLNERGYEVHSSSEPFSCPIYLGSRCSCPVGTNCTDIIITDINMPNMTGLEFIENQKKKNCKVKNIAVMSGRWTDDKLQHAKVLGCHTFDKPFMLEKIENWLDCCEKK